MLPNGLDSMLTLRSYPVVIFVVFKHHHLACDNRVPGKSRYHRVIEQELHKNAAVITKVSETASKEMAIESALDKMQGAWAVVKLNTEEYRETGPIVYGIKGPKAAVPCTSRRQKLVVSSEMSWLVT